MRQGDGGLRYQIATRTETGKVRDHNEDHVQVLELEGGAAVVLADGVARHAGGEVASRIAVETLLSSLPRDVLALGEEAQLGALVRGLEAAHQAIEARAEQQEELTGLGTTAVAALLGPERVVYQHCGDSRLYWLRGGRVERVTRDHSAVQVLIELGRLRPEDAASHPMAGKLTSFLGGGRPWVNVQLSPGTEESASFGPGPGDVVVLCSDGVNVELGDDRLAELACSEGSAEERAGRLIEEVLSGEARDNATVALALVLEPGVGDEEG